MYYYKVVKTVGDKYYSCNDTEHSIEYKLGEFVQPKLVGSRLFVFECIKDAKRFAYDLRVFLVECTNPRQFKLRARNSLRFDIFWDCIAANGVGLGYEDLGISPEGTYVCDSVKLIKEV
jgi:hypothetical protein